MRVLVLNAGSSTLKWTLLEGRDRTTIQSGEQEWRVREGRAHQVRATLREVPAFDAVGHRVVHGGTRFRHAVVIDREVRLALESLMIRSCSREESVRTARKCVPTWPPRWSSPACA